MSTVPRRGSTRAGGQSLFNCADSFHGPSLASPNPRHRVPDRSQTSFTLWSQVWGGDYLSLAFWLWKLGIGLGAAALVVAMTATLVQNDERIRRRVLSLASILVIMMLAAGELS